NKIKSGISVRLDCDYCGGPINDAPKVLRFANIERFLCCEGCKKHYKEKYRGRIESIVEQYEQSKK
ncbi:MAG: TRASH domain-containing protein, partial [Nitrosopumilaceae archaeon]